MTSVEKNWIGLRNSGIRIIFLGLFSLILTFIIYGRLTTPSGEQTVMITPYLMNLANAVFTIIFLSMLFVGYGIYRIFKAEQRLKANTNSLIFYITAAFLDNKYWKVMAIFAIIYGIFFGFLSQIFIYRYDISFSEQGITVPSVNVIPCCNMPGYVPMLTVFPTDHFLIMIIPINIILAVIVSFMVGFNISLTLYAFNLDKAQNTKRVSSVGSVGAISGLFVGCPTCAGSLFSMLLGYSVGTTMAVLAQFQTLFILISIPSLILAPFLIGRGIRSRYSCKLA
ncbi:MAG TPA: hypothetical protein VKA95_10875 [Nitrososphaeraceae archaeon]|jgi:hypothetical protein|nr:hypothetical protein [Nitrososphaeraceae archaeon]